MDSTAQGTVTSGRFLLMASGVFGCVCVCVWIQWIASWLSDSDPSLQL